MVVIIMRHTLAHELKHHVPFTAFGAFTAIIVMLIIVMTGSLPSVNGVAEPIFYVLHPLHITFSAIVTASMYHKYRQNKMWLTVIFSFLIAVGMATISDSLIPFLGEWALGLPNREIHIGFIEEWWIITLAATIGIAIGILRPTTRLPHSAHVLISTWASLFHVVMALGATVTISQLAIIFIFLFGAVWLPCCLSDIVLPIIALGKNLLHEHA